MDIVPGRDKFVEITLLENALLPQIQRPEVGFRFVIMRFVLFFLLVTLVEPDQTPGRWL